MLLAYSRRSHRGEHALLPYPKAGNRLNCCRRLIKKEEAAFHILLGVGEGGGKKLIVQFYFHPPPNFLFRSAAAG